MMLHQKRCYSYSYAVVVFLGAWPHLGTHHVAVGREVFQQVLVGPVVRQMKHEEVAASSDDQRLWWIQCW